MMRFFYTLIFYCAVPFILLRLLWRSIAAPAYARRWAERFAFIPAIGTAKKTVWIHTVSVGEFIAALPLIHQLQQRNDLQLVITTTTPTGSDRVRVSLGDSVIHVYAPYDLPDVLARFLHRIKPSLLLVMETELWPNTLAACAKRKIPALLINARLSARSARGYQKFSLITTPMLRNLSGALIQNQADAERFLALGLPADKVLVTGSIKFDLTLGDDLQIKARALKRTWSNEGQRKIWIAASTHQGEDEIILDAFAQLVMNPQLKNLLLILVPRHPERFNTVTRLASSRGFSVARRSENTLDEQTQILIGDTMGELLLSFGASDIAFVGGSLVPNGGHNFIEPAAWALPLLSGEHVFNFAEVARLLEEAGALQLVESASALAQAVELLAINEQERLTRGAAALRVANENRGALAKTINVIETYLKK